MRRELDYMRELLLQIEGGKKDYDNSIVDANNENKEEFHLLLLRDAGFIELSDVVDGGVFVRRITNQGHDFLDSIRDSGFWRKVRKVAEDAGVYAISEVAKLAIVMTLESLKKQVEL